MDINDLESKLNNISTDLNKEKIKLKEISKKFSELEHDNEIDEYKLKENYYQYFSDSEKKYMRENDKYKKLISGFSKAYLEMSDFYVGPELPRDTITFLDSSKDIEALYFLFCMSLFLK